MYKIKNMRGRRRQRDDDSDEWRSPGDPSAVRMENSLGTLTKNFVKLLQNSEDKSIDLNDAVNVNIYTVTKRLKAKDI